MDDDARLLEALRTALSPPHDVLAALTGREALTIVQQHPLDMVLLDYLLPDISGLVLLRVLKQAYASLLVILMTGFGSEEVVIEALRGGAYDYLKKPISVTDLQARVEKLLMARREARDLEPRLPWLLDPTQPGAKVGPHEASIRRAVALIDKQLHTEIRLDQVAREAGMSKFHFCRHFKDVTGLTFREFLARRRIARAVELLRDQTRTVSEIYLDVGFKNLSHFSRVFLKLTGKSPSRYRLVVAESAREDVPPSTPCSRRADDPRSGNASRDN